MGTLKAKTASKMQQLLACAYSLRPDVPVEALATTRYAADGTTGHKLLGAILLTGKDHPEAKEMLRTKAMREVHETFRPWAEGMHRAYKKTLQLEIPAAYCYRENTSRSLFLKSERDYQLTETEVAGTCDLVYTDLDGVLCIDDMKLGFNVPPPAEDNRQMQTLGLIFGALRRVQKVRLRIIHKSNLEPEPYEMDRFDMDAHALLIKETFGDISQAAPVAGDHCKYCEATACPKDPRKKEAA